MAVTLRRQPGGRGAGGQRLPGQLGGLWAVRVVNTEVVTVKTTKWNEHDMVNQQATVGVV